MQNDTFCSPLSKTSNSILPYFLVAKSKLSWKYVIVRKVRYKKFVGDLICFMIKRVPPFFLFFLSSYSFQQHTQDTFHYHRFLSRLLSVCSLLSFQFILSKMSDKRMSLICQKMFNFVIQYTKQHQKRVRKWPSFSVGCFVIVLKTCHFPYPVKKKNKNFPYYLSINSHKNL